MTQYRVETKHEDGKLGAVYVSARDPDEAINIVRTKWKHIEPYRITSCATFNWELK